MRRAIVLALAVVAALLPEFVQAMAPVASEAAGPAAAGLGGALERAMGGANGGAPLSMSLQLLLLMGLLTILPALVLMMTSFTRIIIVLAILRQALGLQQSPPNQVLIGLSLFLSLFIMAPTLEQVNQSAIEPYAAGQIEADAAISNAGDAFHAFMVRQTRETDLAMFADMAGHDEPFASPQDVPFSILLPSFVTSELKTAFQIGFMIFLPFLVIDLVVASVLMSLGMMMLSPTIISLPFKLLLFVLVDGWALLMGSLAMSFA
ncbi:flagellar type III secretion system pore protein FliP [Alteraurantiacibacter buctensis]|uniref:Flagellar biosynthetic protein FliP n=1 Tax=Alteraurantiacibacter buctensis TaxID=1503981 RepID=A0A844YUC7_9SPHN|nr:flagellar type III secretion system pore protein FliP [Alteraurantiacibacter buctensis]MXO71169.1 flagellar type III secretion system pore protein FliP [Alteraurantiacibacter buctensis]